MSDNLQQLSKIAKLINTDKIISPDEINQVITALAAVLANNKKSTDGITAQAQATMQNALKWVVDQVGQLRNELNAAQTAHSQAVDTKLASTIKQATALVSEAKAAMPKDGKNPDPSEIVPLVLDQIKLPEQKDTLLDGGPEIVQKINELADDDRLKIDVSHIKGLAKGRNGGYTIHGGFRNLSVYGDTTLLTKGAKVIKFVGSGITATESNGVITVSVAGSGGTSTVNSEQVAGSLYTWTLKYTPVAGSEHVFALGQRLLPGVGNGYVITDNVIITTNAYPAGALVADYNRP